MRRLKGYKRGTFAALILSRRIKRKNAWLRVIVVFQVEKEANKAEPRRRLINL